MVAVVHTQSINELADYCERNYIKTGQGTGGHEEVLPGEHAGHGYAGAPGQTYAAPGRDGGQRQPHLSGL